MVLPRYFLRLVGLTLTNYLINLSPELNRRDSQAVKWTEAPRGTIRGTCNERQELLGDVFPETEHEVERSGHHEECQAEPTGYREPYQAATR